LQLTGLEIDGFRNLRLLRLVPSPSFNVFIGDNGAGKTNLLEAIYFLGRLRSFRASRLEQLIQHGRAQAAVSATFQQDAMTSRVDLELTPQGRRVKVDGKGPGRIGDYCSRFQVVLFTPEDVELPRGAPRLRRQLLDRALFNHRPGYLAEAQRLAEVLQRRNAVLHGARGAVPRDLLEPYDRQLAEVGALVACRRRDLVAELGPAFQRILAQLLGVHEAGELRYRSTVPGVDEGADPETASQRYLARLTADRPRDLALRTTTTGPQRDDLLLLLAGRPLKEHGSQGQHRIFVLALKITEIELLRQQRGSAPLLLLDDLSSELDGRRNEQLFDYLATVQGQVFITTTAPALVRIPAANRLALTVRGGSLGYGS